MSTYNLWHVVFSILFRSRFYHFGPLSTPTTTTTFCIRQIPWHPRPPPMIYRFEIKSRPGTIRSPFVGDPGDNWRPTMSNKWSCVCSTHSMNRVHSLPFDNLLCTTLHPWCVCVFWAQKSTTSVPGAPPRNVTAEAASPTTIAVSWLPPPAERSNGLIVYYKLHFVEVGQSDNEATVTTLNQTEMVIDELKKWTAYKVWVLAGTVVGDGPISYPITVRTLEDGTYSRASTTIQHQTPAHYSQICTNLELAINKILVYKSLTFAHRTNWSIYLN